MDNLQQEIEKLRETIRDKQQVIGEMRRDLDHLVYLLGELDRRLGSGKAVEKSSKSE